MAQHSLSSLANATSYLIPSASDLLLAVPRLLLKAGSVAEHIDSVFDNLRSGGSVIAEPTSANLTNATIVTTSGQTFVQESVAAVAGAAASTPGRFDAMLQSLKHMASLFGYLTSKWAIATFAFVCTCQRIQVKQVQGAGLTNPVRQYC